MAGGSENITQSDYIRHHLQNLTFGQHSDGSWGMAHSPEEAQAMGFWAFNVDTMFWAVVLGAAFFFLFRNVAKKANSGVPTRFQAAIEFIIEFVDNSVRESFHGSSKFIAPLALTLFVWIFFMNFMDLIPVDWLPWLATSAGIPYQKVVPTTDVKRYYEHVPHGVHPDHLLQHQGQGHRRLHRRADRTAIRIGQQGGQDRILHPQPFAGTCLTGGQAHIAGPETIRQHVRGGTDFHSDRDDFLPRDPVFVASGLSSLFGEHIPAWFWVVATLMVFVTLWLNLKGKLDNKKTLWLLLAEMLLVGGMAFLGGQLMHFGWAVFHLLIVTLQAFIFMMLTIVYLSMAHEHH